MSERNPLDELERVFEVATRGLEGELVGLEVDVVDEGAAFVLYADVAGVDAADVNVRVADGRDVTVEVTGDRSVDVADGEFVVRERTRRSSSRTVSLPAAVEETAASATVEGGVLEVRLPKREGTEDGTSIPVE